MKSADKSQLADSEDFRKVRQAAVYLQGQACTLAARHISDGTLRLQFNRDIAYYMRGIVRDVQDGRSTVDDALKTIKEEWDNLRKQGKNIAPKVIGLTAGGAQIYAGAKACVGGGPAGCTFFGVPLIAHGTNNVYENGANLYYNRSDTEGPLKDVYQWIARAVGGTDYHGSMAYGTVDLLLSGYGLARLVKKDGAWRLWRYARADMVRGYKTVSGAALVHEIAGNGVTIMGMRDQWETHDKKQPGK